MKEKLSSSAKNAADQQTGCKPAKEKIFASVGTASGSHKARKPKMTYGSDLLAAVHEMASDLHEVGVMKTATMREFDELCLTPVHDLRPEQIREIRERSGVSQAVMARVVNVTISTVGQWERGERKPAGTSLKLLTLAKEHGLESIY